MPIPQTTEAPMLFFFSFFFFFFFTAGREAAKAHGVRTSVKPPLDAHQWCQARGVPVRASANRSGKLIGDDLPGGYSMVDLLNSTLVTMLGSPLNGISQTTSTEYQVIRENMRDI